MGKLSLNNKGAKIKNKKKKNAAVAKNAYFFSIFFWIEFIL